MMRDDPTVASRLLIIDDNESIHIDFHKALDTNRADSEALNNAKAALFGAQEQVASRPIYDIDSAYQGQQGYEMVANAIEEQRAYSVAFIDMRMPPGWDGVETIEHIWQIDDAIQVVICTAYVDYLWSEIVDRLGTSDRLLILKKPFDNIEVCQLASALSQKHRLTREVQRHIEDLNLTVEDRTAALSQSESHIRAILESAAECIISANHLGEIVEFNPAAEQVFGYSRDEVLGKRFTELISPAARTKQELSFLEHVESDMEMLGKRLEVTAMRRDGSEFPIETTVTTIQRNGRPCFTAILHDISERKQMETRLRHEAMHDSLTSLPNRALLMDRLRQAVARVKRNANYGFAVLFLDLDRFKNINDSLGHLIGDQILIKTASRLQACVRSIDSVARIGGDEFAILLDGSPNAQDAIRIAERIIASLAEPFYIDGNQLHTAASIGIALGTEDYSQADDILRDADIGMYQAKSGGKGRYVLFSPEMHDRAKQILDTENELRDAITNHELVSFYQPIVSLQTGRPLAFESLVRWQHPVRGLIPPAEFLPIARESGMMVPIDWHVLRESLSQVASWKRHCDGGPLLLSVNFSPKHLQEQCLVGAIERMIADCDLSPKNLAIEVTEEAVLDKSSTVLSVLNDLKSAGFRLWIDDFGTGYASLSHLHQFPFDTLKIDRSFLTSPKDNGDNWHIIEAVIELSHNLGITVVAEGIETQEQCDRLQSLRCDFGQGYLFSQPLPSEEARLFWASSGQLPQLGVCVDETGSAPTVSGVVNV